MILNPNGWLGSDSGGGGEITIVGSTNHFKTTIAEMEAIANPKSGDICRVAETNELYMYNSTTWEVVSTDDNWKEFVI